MSRKLNGWGLAALTLALVVSIGCAESANDEAADAAANNEAAWTELQEQKAALDAKRAELAEARAAAEGGDEAADAGAGAEAGAEAEEGADAAADPAVEVARLESEVAADAEAFYTALVDYINTMGMVEGEELTPRQREALRLKSSEDMVLAQEYIDRGGNYPKAIRIYEDALALDSDNEDLQAALAQAEANRYMSEERFAAAEKGMTQAEVRRTLGQPNLSNVKQYDDGKAEAWFYPTDVHGSAAAVWFQQRDGAWRAYDLNFEQVVRDGPTEVGGSDDAEAEDAA